jgi:zinc-binding in reverse transcriptase
LVGNGESINFWHDNWFNNYSLSLQFPLVFSKAKSDRVTLSQVWNFGNAKIFLTRGVSSAMLVEKTRLLFILSNLHLSSDSDSIFWHLDKSGLFTVHYMYKFLNSGGVHTLIIRSVWSLRISLKFKLFLWLALHNRILSRDNLLRRGW